MRLAMAQMRMNENPDHNLRKRKHPRNFKNGHIASFPHFFEEKYYTPSNTGFHVNDVEVSGKTIKIGAVICFDRHFPESIRFCVFQGADPIMIPTANLEEESEKLYLWELRVQAMQNWGKISSLSSSGRIPNTN